MKSKHPQLALTLPLMEEARFDNFVVGDNVELVTHLSDMASGARSGNLFVYGGPGVGRSHLLQAVCQQADNLGTAFIYLPLSELMDLDPQVLADIESVSILCIDDLERIAGLGDWEEALFHLYNRVHQAGGSMIFSASCKASDLGVKLADLASRLNNAATYYVAALTDAGNAELLKLRARQRGLTFRDDALAFLLSRVQRDTGTLLALWDRIDALSLAAGRPISIPLIKQALDE